MAPRGHRTPLREGTRGNILLCKRWFATNRREGKCDFSEYLAFSQGVLLVVYCGSHFIVLYYFGLDKWDVHPHHHHS